MVTHCSRPDLTLSPIFLVKFEDFLIRNVAYISFSTHNGDEYITEY